MTDHATALAGLGAGALSDQARARLARGVATPEPARPDLGDHAAVAAWRVAVHRLWGEGTEGDEPVHTPEQVAGVSVLVAGPAEAPLTVVYAHGGGYVLGSPGVAAPITARLARTLRVVSVDYRRAPEHPFPAALDDVAAVYAALRAASSGPVAVAGDSAGGALAAGVALRAVATGAVAPDALLLLCPHLDHDGHAATADDDAAALIAAYRDGTDPTDPLLSPAHAPAAWLAGLPPTLVQSGTADRLWRQAVRFVRRARAAGAPVELDLWDGLWHTWQYHRDLPEADRAVTEAVAFLLTAARRAAHRTTSADAAVDPLSDSPERPAL